MKRIISFITLFCISISILVTTVYADALPDLTKEITLTVNFRYDGKNIGGGEIELYKIADTVIENNNTDHILTSDFKGSSLDLSKDTKELVNDIGAYITEHSCEHITREIDKEGRAVFEELTPGFYFVLQTRSSEDYYPSVPFTIELPVMDENGIYSYDVSVKAKVSPKTNETDDTTKKPDITTKPNGSKLPQTGQLKWPVPILTAIGLGMITIGIILSRGKRKNEE